MNKWHLFKEKRAKVVDRYLALQRKCKSVRALIVVILSRSLISKLSKIYRQKKLEIIRSFSQNITALRCAIKFKIKMKRIGGLDKAMNSHLK
jgi:hypothetical protein